ncbi:MAG: saccharopine dehydrogenase NADP-binding domain-containing protein [Phycisphaerales bacterium]|nr:MAG: saccharopine dehydrogenase NADP-binding domain-containing protein [Phycisphaerales bacterium]
MKKVLVLGAGLVTRPLVRYLLDQPDFRVTVASRTVSKAEALVAGHPSGTTLTLLADETDKLAGLISEHDLAVSLLPAPLHPVVADLCVKHRKHMVTTSYLSPAMKALDGPAHEAGVMILNEIGVDPGIDHMSAMRVIDDAKARGGRIVSFRSYCGGLPAPEANDNPFGYKFSWSPRAVCTAGKSSARFREDGKQVDVPGPDLFACVHPLHVEGIGQLEAYPNRDSLGYVDLYGLEGIDTMFRGTLRYPGWCETLKMIVDLGLLDETPVTYPAGTTYARFVGRFLKSPPSGDVRKSLAGQLRIDAASPILDRLEWLGLFSDETIAITGKETTPLDVLGSRMEQKMQYQPGERDMIALCHYFLAKFESGPDERITSTMIDYGQPGGDSSMARTVSLPAAIAVRLILTGGLMAPGVHIPVTKEIYGPVLDELAGLDIRCVEKTEPLGA